MAITVNEQKRIFFLDGKDTTYAFMINEYNYAEHLYYGKRIGHDDITYIRKNFGITILLIEHDMRLVSGICEKVTVLNFGTELAKGNTAEALSDPEVVKAYLGE